MEDKDLNARIERKILEAASLPEPLTTVEQFSMHLREERAVIYKHLVAMVEDGRMVKHARMNGNFYFPAGHEPSKPNELKNNPFALSKDAKHHKVLEAIDAKKRTNALIYEYTGWPHSFDLPDLLAEMAIEKIIRIVEQGTLTAVFRYNQMPRRFWNSGERTIEAEMDNDFVVRDEDAVAKDMTSWSSKEPPPSPGLAVAREKLTTERLEAAASRLPSQKKIADELGMTLGSLQFLLRQSESLRKAYNDGRDRNPLFCTQTPAEETTDRPEVPEEVTQPISVSEPNYEPDEIDEPVADDDGQPEPIPRPKRKYRARLSYTEEQMEDLGLKYGTIAQAAIGLGYVIQPKSRNSGLHNYLDRHPDLKAAFARGGAQHQKANSVGDVPPPHRSTKPRTIDPVRAEELAASGVSMQKAAHELGVGYSTLRRHIEGYKPDKTILEAWNRGLARRSDTTFPSQIIMEIDERDLTPVHVPAASLPQIVAPVATPSDQQTVVPLERGSLSIGFSGNFFEMTAKDRSLLMKIADLIQETDQKT